MDTPLSVLAAQIRAARGVAHKRDIAGVVDALQASSLDGIGRSNGEGIALSISGITPAVPIGDDCAAWRDGDAYTLFAAEGFVSDFIAAEPYFAGYCGVMVNVSDVYAMGGLPVAIVDTFWSRDAASAAPILAGLRDASRIYGVPIVGGHSNCRSTHEQLSVAIMGRASHLLTSFDARPGQHLVCAIDLRGRFHTPFPYWDASTGAPAQRLRDDLAVMPSLAEAQWCHAAKDISMAGIVGTAMMFAECSKCGVTVDVDAIPRPTGVELRDWLGIFPSYGFLLAVDDAHLDKVLNRFSDRGLSAGSVGRFDASHTVRLARTSPRETADVWHFDCEPLTGCGPTQAAPQTRDRPDSGVSNLFRSFAHEVQR